MPTNFIRVESGEQLSQLFEASSDRSVVLFKHSSTCGISAGVMHDVSIIDGDIHVISMQTQRPLAMEIASRTGIRHESPQAIVLVGGKPVYSASHYDIEPATLQSYLNGKYAE
ncbi:MAG: bacillithiol system redox-active protein YtxJ [Pyrinomonadaceae bacterium]